LTTLSEPPTVTNHSWMIATFIFDQPYLYN
jgi:hypothetical protein